MDGTILNKKYSLEERVKALEEGGGGGGYVLPTATDERLGGIKVGSNLTVEEDGTLNAPAPTPPYTPPAYSTSEYDTGKKWIDGKTIYGKVLQLGSAITVDANSWSSDIDLVGDKIISVSVINSTDNNVFPVGGNITSNKLSILNPRGSAITVDTIIVEYTKTEVTEKKK